MSRMRQAWYYTRQAQEAQARATHFANRTYQANQGAVRQRGESATMFYRSLTQIQGTTHDLFQVSLSEASLQAGGGDTGLGLLNAAPAGTVVRQLRGSRVKPSIVRWHKGTTTPTRKTTAWNTQYIKYYADSDGVGGVQSHYSAPISKASGSFDAGDIQSAFRALFEGSAGTTRLGDKNGYARLTLETAPFTAQT